MQNVEAEDFLSFTLPDQSILQTIDARAVRFGRTREEEISYGLECRYGLREPHPGDRDMIERLKWLREQCDMIHLPLPKPPLGCGDCSPPDPALLPTLRAAIARQRIRLRTMAVLVASTGKRQAAIRVMRWEQLYLEGQLWVYRPGKILTLSAQACALLKEMPRIGPWVFPLTWSKYDRPWSEDAVEKAWERFRLTLPSGLRQLTLTGLRACREAWNALDATEPQDPSLVVTGLPMRIDEILPALADIVNRRLQGDTEGAETMTLGELVALYLAGQLQGKASYDYTRRTLYRHFGEWFDRPAPQIKKVELITWQSAQVSRPGHGNRALGMLRAVFNWAIRLDILTCKNPTAGLRRLSSRSRMRFVEEHEKDRLAWAIRTAPLRDRAFLTLLLLTGARSGEARTMEWAHVNLTQRRWVKPTTKNGRPHIVPLRPQVVELLAQLPQTSKWVFPGLAGEPIHPATIRKVWHGIRTIAGVPDVTLHDLRRTCASWMAINGANLSTIQHTLNHASLTPTAIYARLSVDAVDKALQDVEAKLLPSPAPELPTPDRIDRKEGAS